MFAGAGSSNISTSPDGVTWTGLGITSNPFIADRVSFKGIAYGGGRFVAVAKQGMIAYSNSLE